MKIALASASDRMGPRLSPLALLGTGLRPSELLTPSMG